MRNVQRLAVAGESVSHRLMDFSRTMPLHMKNGWELVLDERCPSTVVGEFGKDVFRDAFPALFLHALQAALTYRGVFDIGN